MQLPYRPVFYGPLALLHGSVALRLAGDALADGALLRWRGAATALALASLVVTMASAALHGTRR